MENKISIDLAVLVPAVLAVLAPAITGFLQQWHKKFSESASWYYKGPVASAIGALMGLIASYAASGDELTGAALGALVGAFGSVNIYFRKGTRGNLALELQKQAVAEPPK